MKNWGKALLVILVIGAFLIPTFFATRYVSLSHICQGYVDTLSNLTGLNTYLATALGALVFVPFSIGVSWSLSWRSERRRAGEAILLDLFVLYNLALLFGTRHAYFGFSKGETLKWYALTPDGVQLYDRAGVDPKWGHAWTPKGVKLQRRFKVFPVNTRRFALQRPAQSVSRNSGSPQ